MGQFGKRKIKRSRIRTLQTSHGFY